MVCQRCITTVRDELSRLGFDVRDTGLGYVNLAGSPDAGQRAVIDQALQAQGFALLQDRKAALIQQVKDRIQQWLSSEDSSEKTRMGPLLAQEAGLEYDALSSLFSQTEGVTLEKYIIGRRLDKVMEWLVYSDLSLTEIAFRTGYSSVAHLSNQFRQYTGLTPTFFRQLRRDKETVQEAGKKS